VPARRRLDRRLADADAQRRAVAARVENHICPLQFDIVDRAIRLYSNPGELVLDPFAGLGTVPMRAVEARAPRRGVELKVRKEVPLGQPGSERYIARHYRPMTITEIAAMPVGELAARDAHLFLWVTGPILRQAFEVMEAWGFRYSAVAFTWVKLKRSIDTRQLRITADPGIRPSRRVGLTTSKNAEFCLLGRRGSARRNAKDVREIILSPVREHSRKPDEQYGRIERYCDGPYLELFARQRTAGLDRWGLETAGSRRRPDGRRPPSQPPHKRRRSVAALCRPRQERADRTCGPTSIITSGSPGLGRMAQCSSKGGGK
jgi:N6-adenosine-specific RNA methylase IME4